MSQYGHPFAYFSWIPLSTAPSQRLSNLVSIHEDEMICCPEKYQFDSQFIICRLSTTLNRWTQTILNNPTGSIVSSGCIAAEPSAHRLLLYGDQSLTTVDLDDYHFTVKKEWRDKHVGNGSNAVSLIIHHQFHLIGGTRNKSHLQWDNSKNELVRVHKFNRLQSLQRPGFLYLESKRMCLLFGGHDFGGNGTALNDIWVFSVINYKWSRLMDKVSGRTSKLPVPLKDFAFCSTINERFVILCGGMHSEFGEYSRDIYIWNLRSGEFRMSRVQCPLRARFRAICMNDESMRIVVEGLLRRVYGQYMYYIRDMIQWITKWIGMETVYLVAYLTGRTWKIRVADLLTI